jgi:hypothetical protein
MFSTNTRHTSEVQRALREVAVACGVIEGILESEAVQRFVQAKRAEDDPDLLGFRPGALRVIRLLEATFLRED